MYVIRDISNIQSSGFQMMWAAFIFSSDILKMCLLSYFHLRLTTFHDDGYPKVLEAPHI